MSEKKYIDEKLANAKRRYLEDIINQRENEGVWKGRVYVMVPYPMRQMKFCIKIPDFLLDVKRENLTGITELSSSFSLMVSAEDGISITFYATAENKIYEPSEVHSLFDRLFPGNHLSSIEYIGEKNEVCYFDYVSKEGGNPFLHTVFLLAAGNRQILGHLNGEAQEWENLTQMRNKMLLSVEGEGHL